MSGRWSEAIERLPGARHLDVHDLHAARVVDVVQVQHREESRVGAPALQVRGRCPRSRTATHSSVVARPLTHSLKSPRTIFGPVDAPVVDEDGEPAGLVAALEHRRAEVHVVDVQRRPAADARSARWQARGSHVRHERSYWLWCAIGRRLRTTLPNWCCRERADRRHHPAHPEAAPISSACPAPAGPAPITSCSATTSASISREDLDDARRRRTRRSMPRQRWML